MNPEEKEDKLSIFTDDFAYIDYINDLIKSSLVTEFCIHVRFLPINVIRIDDSKYQFTFCSALHNLLKLPTFKHFGETKSLLNNDNINKFHKYAVCQDINLRYLSVTQSDFTFQYKICQSCDIFESIIISFDSILAADNIEYEACIDMGPIKLKLGNHIGNKRINFPRYINVIDSNFKSSNVTLTINILNPIKISPTGVHVKIGSVFVTDDVREDLRNVVGLFIY